MDAIYFDFAKAFDKVPRERLMQKIKTYGIGRKILDWIKSWMSERKQRVCIQEERLHWRDVWSGVPQRSVLGRVLFLIFIYDIDIDVISSILKFADDTKVFSEVNHDQDRIKLQIDLNKLSEGSHNWQMPAKSVKLCISAKRTLISHTSWTGWSYNAQRQRDI